MELAKELEPRADQEEMDEKKCHKCGEPGWTRLHRCKPNEDPKKKNNHSVTPDKEDKEKKSSGKNCFRMDKGSSMQQRSSHH